MSDKDEQQPAATEKKVEWKTFLAEASLASQSLIRGLVGSPGNGPPILYKPEMEFYCPAESCKRVVGAYCQGQVTLHPTHGEPWIDNTLAYKCYNCHIIIKIFAVRVRTAGQKHPDGEAIKYGEWPPFKMHVPSRVINIFGPDRDLFLKGRQCEMERLGVGAFAYYRQIVEGQKGRLLGEIKKVAQRSG